MAAAGQMRPPPCRPPRTPHTRKRKKPAETLEGGNDLALANAASRRLMAVVCYDGTDWSGWQTQAHGKTVQDALEARLSGVGEGGNIVSPHAAHPSLDHPTLQFPALRRPTRRNPTPPPHPGALEPRQLLRGQTTIAGAGRTDAGVHAKAQVRSARC